MADKVIYLDNAASTFVHPNILEAFNKFIALYPGNPGSIHKYGQEATRLLDKSRALILSTFNLKDYEVVFTSGATEANNLAIKGVCHAYKNRGKHIIVSEVEHPAVLEVVRELEKDFDFKVTYLPVTEDGSVDLEKFKEEMTEDTVLVSIMAANNEIGAVNDIHEIAQILKNYPKTIFHVDAVQAIGKVPFDLNDADLVTIAGHKIHALVGCGALIKKQKIMLDPVVNGGGQEDGFRSGTVSLPLCASLALAIKDAKNNQKDDFKKALPLAKRLSEYIKQYPDIYVLNSDYEKNPFLINFSLLEHKASVVVEALSEENILVSSTSACHSKGEPYSYVVYALRKDMGLAHNSIRVSFADQNTIEDVEALISALDRIVRRIKQ